MRNLDPRLDEHQPATTASMLHDVGACPAANLAAWVLSTGETSAAPLDAAALGAVTRVLHAIDSLPDAFMVLDLQGVVRWASSGTSEVLGWRPRDLTGRPISVLALQEDDEQQQHFLEELRLTGRSSTFTTHHRRGDGSVMEVSVSTAPIRSAAAEVVGYCASVRNTTQQTRLLTQLAEQENVSVMLNRRSSDVSLISKPDTEITYISPSVVDVLGYTPEQIVGTKGLLFVHEDDLPEVTAFVTRVVSTPDAVERLTFRITKAQGDWIWVEETLTNCVNVPGVQGLVANIRDVTGEVEARIALTMSERRYRTIVETAQEGVVVLAQDTTILFVNRKAAEMLGHSRSTLHRRRMTEFFDSTSAEEGRLRTASRAQRGHERYEVTYPHPDGRGRIFEVSASPMSLDGPDGATGSLAMISDVTDARFAEVELRHRALHDPLTGLPNRALFDDRLLMALSRQVSGTDQQTVAVLSIDLDGFKLINGVHGHDVGDAILVEVAQRLRAASGPADTVARPGSDEFVVIAEGVDVDAAVELAERMRRALLEPIATDTSVVYVDASVGIALSPPHGAGSLLRSADAALSQAKAMGRARVLVHDQSCDTGTARRLELATGVREALATDTMTLGYQPIVDLDTGGVVAVEALLRWEHPCLGPVPPPEVVATAYEIGLAGRLDQSVLERACTDMARLRESVPGIDLALSVNLSSPSFTSRLPQVLCDVSSRTGWPLSRITLEITENVLMGNPSAAAAVLSQLRDLGVTVAIDDFGTGYSSLSYLKQLPVGTLKVDRSFVEHVPGDPGSCAIARSVTQLARALALTTVAEGIESQEQADFMHQLGCTLGQGYLWSPAVSPTELESLLRTWP